MSTDILSLLQQAKTPAERSWLLMQLSLESLSSELQEAVWAAAVLRWFDESYLKAVLDNPAFSSFEQLISLSYLEPFENRGYNIHELSRKLLQQRLWDERPDYYRQLSSRAAEYCAKQNLDDFEWNCEYICHLLIANPEHGADKFNSACIDLTNPPIYAYEKVEELIRAVREVEFAALIAAEAVCYCLYWEAKIGLRFYKLESSLDKLKQLENYEINDKWLLSEAAALYGDIMSRMYNYAAARRQYEQALPLYQEVGSKLGQANTIQALGDVERMLANYPSAKNYFEKALKIYQEIGDNFGELDCIFAFGELDRAYERWSNAIDKYLQAAAFYEKKGLRLEHASVLWQLGMAHVGAKNNDMASKYLNLALNIFEEIKNKRSEKVKALLDALEQGQPIDPRQQFE